MALVVLALFLQRGTGVRSAEGQSPEDCIVNAGALAATNANAITPPNTGNAGILPPSPSIILTQVVDCTGPTGATGPSGPRGAQGLDGDDGSDGRDGAQGPAGPAGEDGTRGPTGATGEKGPAGDPGPTGDTGAIGPTGPTGADGYSTLFVTTPISVDGACGDETGQHVDYGLDNGDSGGTPGDGTLQAGEIDDGFDICNGAAGPTGDAGPQGEPGAAACPTIEPDSGVEAFQSIGHVDGDGSTNDPNEAKSDSRWYYALAGRHDGTQVLADNDQTVYGYEGCTIALDAIEVSIDGLASPLATTTFVFTLFINGVDTGKTCTIYAANAPSNTPSTSCIISGPTYLLDGNTVAMEVYRTDLDGSASNAKRTASWTVKVIGGDLLGP